MTVRGATASTAICSPTSSPRSTPTDRTSTGRPPPSTRRSRRTAPTTGPSTCGTCGTASTTSTTERTGRASSPSSASRRHPPPPRSLRRSRPAARASIAPSCSTTRRPIDGEHKLRRVARPPLRRRRRLRRLAVPHPGQPGAGDRRRHRPLPRPARTLLGRRVVAAQRLLALDQLGSRRPRRAAQTDLVRAAPLVRRPAARPRATRRRRRRGSSSSTTPPRSGSPCRLQQVTPAATSSPRSTSAPPSPRAARPAGHSPDFAPGDGLSWRPPAR